MFNAAKAGLLQCRNAAQRNAFNQVALRNFAVEMSMGQERKYH